MTYTTPIPHCRTIPPGLRLDIPQMDRDHDDIAAAFDDTERVLADRHFAGLVDVLAHLGRTLGAHFAAEEELLLTYCYPKLPGHADSHRMTLAELKTLVRVVGGEAPLAEIGAAVARLKARFYEDLLQDREYMWYFRDRAIYPELPLR